MIESQDTHHSTRLGVGGRLHGEAALLYYPQGIGKVHHSGEDERGVFSQAQAGCRATSCNQLRIRLF